ncbi:hypothetical protein JOQ06_021679 [Pogonophryne albipinna]|uniref:Uncharacterized protein n=1 Tax=Pogonophryne albipinna TaxID=1090488 RepID=A0AAD6ABQ4_9TELE|nr:hypothetical protein JOQ06_021679 [Pogonophryne albipinna]
MTDQELFWGTDQYDFSVVVPAAGLECFWHFAHRGERFYLSFMTGLDMYWLKQGDTFGSAGFESLAA